MKIKLNHISLILTSIAILYSAVDKLLLSQNKVNLFIDLFPSEDLNFILILFSVFDIFLLVFYLMPKTRRFAFLINICYYSGAMAMRISVDNPPYEPLIILILLFISTFLNEKEMFLKK